MEEEAIFDLWELIRDYAEKNDVSYYTALEKVLPEYIRKCFPEKYVKK